MGEWLFPTDSYLREFQARVWGGRKISWRLTEPLSIPPVGAAV
jgi:hypothetical protein